MSVLHRPPWRGLVSHALVAALVIVALRPAFPALPEGLVAGAAAGALLFALLVRPVAFRASPRRPTGLAVSLSAVVLVGAAGEEVVWRLGVLGTLVSFIGWPIALATTTLLFAAAHVPAQGRRGLTTHLVTGGTFGAVFLLSGDIAAAVAAHAAYNALVCFAPPPATSRGTCRRAVPARAWAPPEPVAASPAVALPPCARLVDVRKRFGKNLALDGLDLQVARGEIVCLLGPNGAGKTTAVSLLLGLRRPDGGVVEIFGTRPREAAARRRLGATPQEAVYPPTLRVAEIASLVRAHYAAPAPLGELLDRFGLSELAHRQVGGLSGGQRRRLAVALAFAGTPELVVLDEPTAGLDIEARRRLWATVQEFAVGGGAVLFTTHHLDEAESLATRIVLLARGRVATSGSVSEIRAQVGLVQVGLPLQPLPPLPSVVRREDGGGRTTLVVRDVAAVLHALVDAAADLSSLEVRPLGLEEVFSSLTEGARR